MWFLKLGAPALCPGCRCWSPGAVSIWILQTWGFPVPGSPWCPHCCDTAHGGAVLSSFIMSISYLIVNKFKYFEAATSTEEVKLEETLNFAGWTIDFFIPRGYDLHLIMTLLSLWFGLSLLNLQNSFDFWFFHTGCLNCIWEELLETSPGGCGWRIVPVRPYWCSLVVLREGKKGKIYIL